MNAEMLNAAAELLEQANADIEGLTKKLVAANARIVELEQQKPAAGLSDQDAKDLKQMVYWRQRTSLVCGVLGVAVGQPLPGDYEKLVRFLGEKFISSEKVSAFLRQEVGQATRPAPAPARRPKIVANDLKDLSGAVAPLSGGPESEEDGEE